ncbi:MAG: bifunctional glutamate N-acetyltransferase/amino-acid acetyltransferase ArgJ [Verrucomicrobiaceae bacterium]|nr:bifunctional glutamate N-acetyltransferase/amino-acid acetyltransferase ArgJ [Verrucomicrobiaceae bacterium]
MEKNYKINIVEDVAGVSVVQGFSAGAAACDIRNKNDFNRLDTAVIVSDVLATAAGVFTTNDVKAAPVLVDIANLERSKKVKAIVANSGNANACTGDRGMDDARNTCSYLAEKLGVEKNQILVCSTGRIGEFMPMEKLKKGIDEAVSGMSKTEDKAIAAANAILTSDTRSKTVSVDVEFGGKKVKIAGMAKGAGMIEPNMATMLAFIVSDAKISQSLLKECLKFAANKSFNRITVDGDMSTNDTVLCLCNGTSGVEISEDDADSIMAFREGLLEASRVLARKIVGDGEKITKVVEVNVKGARTEEQAEKICRAIGNSLLVKSSWFGEDPNWGRITDSAGYARTGLVLEKIDLDYDGIPVLKSGQPIAENKELWKQAVSKKTFSINLHLNLGTASESILASDLTDGYVNFNKGE